VYQYLGVKLIEVPRPIQKKTNPEPSKQLNEKGVPLLCTIFIDLDSQC